MSGASTETITKLDSLKFDSHVCGIELTSLPKGYILDIASDGVKSISLGNSALAKTLPLPMGINWNMTGSQVREKLKDALVSDNGNTYGHL